MAPNTIQNNSLARLTARAPGHILQAIKQASARTGVNFAYMVQQASAESSFNPAAKARTSSAAGLYQFIESTWLNMVKKYGDKYGMEAQAAQINEKGRVADRTARKEILELRKDPQKAAAMAAEFARENEEFLKTNWGGEVGSTELYFAHFMGAGGAASFLRARDADPTQQAALIFPDAARANRNVFYDTRTGRPKTIDEVYAFFDRKFDIKEGDFPMPEQQSDILIAEKKNTQASMQIASVVFTNIQEPETDMIKKTPEKKDTSFQFAGRRYNSLVPAQHLVTSPTEIMFLAQMDLPTVKSPRKTQ